MNTIQIGEKRDAAIVEFVNKFKFAKTEHIEKLFFNGSQSYRVCCRRLKHLTDKRKLSRYPEKRLGQYIYYAGKKSSKEGHFLAVLEAYLGVRGCPGYITRFEVEVRLDFLNEFIIPDAICWHKKPDIVFFLEVELSTNKFKFDSYKKYYLSNKWKEKFDKFPLVVILTDREEIKKQAKEQPIPFLVTSDIQEVIKWSSWR